jgi:hypothetical protein
VSKGAYAMIVTKYINQLERKGRISDKHYNLLLDWYVQYEQQNT